MECGCRYIRVDCKWAAAVWSCELQVTWVLWHPCLACRSHSGNLLYPWMLQVPWSSRKFPSACLLSLTWCAYLLWLENPRAGGEGGGLEGRGGTWPGEQQRAQIGQPGREEAQLRLGVPGLPVPPSPRHSSWGLRTLVASSARSGAGRSSPPWASAFAQGKVLESLCCDWTDTEIHFLFPQALQIWQRVAESGCSFCWCSRFWLWNTE